MAIGLDDDDDGRRKQGQRKNLGDEHSFLRYMLIN